MNVQQFDEDMVRAIKFSFRTFYTGGTGNEPEVDAARTDYNMEDYKHGLYIRYLETVTRHDISTDDFWDREFRRYIQHTFFWDTRIWDRFYQFNTLNTSVDDIVVILTDETILDDKGNPFVNSDWETFEYNMGRYIYLFYETRYKQYIKEWAQAEFLQLYPFMPK